MINEVTAIDPLGRTIHLLPSILFFENEEEGILNDVSTIIQKPALLIEAEENHQIHFYYFRSVGWNKTLLLVTRFDNGRWEAYKYEKNPPSEMLSVLLKRGKQII
jgi:hypothetical protein